MALIVAAGVLYYLGEDWPGATIEQPERDAGTLVVGKPAKMTYQIDNPTRHAVRVVGLAEC